MQHETPSLINGKIIYYEIRALFARIPTYDIILYSTTPLRYLILNCVICPVSFFSRFRIEPITNFQSPGMQKWRWVEMLWYTSTFLENDSDTTLFAINPQNVLSDKKTSNSHRDNVTHLTTSISNKRAPFTPFTGMKGRSLRKTARAYINFRKRDTVAVGSRKFWRKRNLLGRAKC